MALTARRFFSEQDIEILKQAREACNRDPDSNAMNETRLIDEVQARISFDPIAEHRKKAERLVRQAERPRKTPPIGTLWFPGFEPKPYEPVQLIPDDDGETVERDRATAHFIQASIKRRSVNLSRVVAAYERDQAEADEFMIWSADQSISGRPSNQITFGNFVREKGYWQPEPIETDVSDDDDEEE